MSKGPGRISRAIEATLEAEPDNAFTVEDLCDRVYRGINRVEKKHRVAVLRAAKAIVSRRPDIDWMTSEGLWPQGGRRSGAPATGDSGLHRSLTCRCPPAEL